MAAACLLTTGISSIIHSHHVQLNQYLWRPNFLVGYFLTASVNNFAAMKSTVAYLWHPVRGVQIFDLRKKRLLFQFFHSTDMEGFSRVLHVLLILIYYYCIRYSGGKIHH